jgi:hypothetical protein
MGSNHSESPSLNYFCLFDLIPSKKHQTFITLHILNHIPNSINIHNIHTNSNPKKKAQNLWTQQQWNAFTHPSHNQFHDHRSLYKAQSKILKLPSTHTFVKTKSWIYLKVPDGPCFFLWGWGGVGRLFIFSLPCSQCVPNMFSSRSLETPQVHKLFPKACSIALQFYHIWFAQSSILMYINCWGNRFIFILQLGFRIGASIEECSMFQKKCWWGNELRLFQKKVMSAPTN